jgi:glutathione S-transferase
MEAKLYVILGTHPSRTGMLLLEHKGIPYKAVRLPTALQGPSLRLLGVSGNPAPFRMVDGRSPRALSRADRMGTVPTLRIDGQDIKTNRAISRFLDELQPDPPLFPEDPDHRRAVEEAEAWGDEVLQMEARRIVVAAGLRGPGALLNEGDDGRLGPLLWRNRTMRRMTARLIAPVFGVNSRTEAKLLAELPGLLDRVDAWVEAGVLNGERLYAADYMIVSSLAVLSYRLDVRPQLEGRPAMRLADRVLPEPKPEREPVAA